MLLPLIFIGWTLTLSNCAPTQLLYTQPIVRSVIQPIVAAPNPIFVYEQPSVNYQLLRQNPINNTQISEIISIFQDVGNQAQGTFEQLQQWGQSWGQSWGQGWGSNNERLPASTMELKPMLNERFDKQPATNMAEMEMLNKNDNMKLKLSSDTEHKQYYTLAGYPQFYYDLVQPAYRPILSLQPIQSIRARSIADLNPIKNDKFLSQIASTGVVAESNSDIVPAGTVALAEPLKTFVESSIDQQLVDSQPEQNVVKVEPEQPQQQQVPNSFAKFLQDNQVDPAISSRSQSGESIKLNDIPTVVKDAEGGSVAQASPIGAAIAGKAGHAESTPVATAIVGKDSIAIAQPIASAVAGEFGGNFEKKDFEEKAAAEPIKVE